MMRKASVLLLLFAAVCGSTLRPGFTYYNEPKTWSEAQTFCREHHSDLATIRAGEELEGSFHNDVWIGLFKNTKDSEWKWSETDEIANFTNWAFGQPKLNDDKCVVMFKHNHKWNDKRCDSKFSFLCSDESLVKERKTWDQALSGPHLELPLRLASVRTEDDRAYARPRAGEASTDQVWTGLRFLAGQWFWTGDGEAVQDVDEEMQCGRTQRFCGVLVKNSTKRYETEDCSKKLNFLCYRKP
ncbi:macrophage mannose receptor 1-like [Gymnodraco acuticeps]|uniref:Macrophage mannose receptor 1-like n=1 Tax=Gymnodraco acuticeps TaxID=8218 RepID=A0A6P8SVS3_GYMAC|nr:macrophage mannose receptor 1-like [Gymnodraco acuticeps]